MGRYRSGLRRGSMAKRVSALFWASICLAAGVSSCVSGREEGVSATQIASQAERISAASWGERGSWDLNEGWKFHLGEAEGAQSLLYDDADWQSVKLPHDYSITQPYSESFEAESGYLPGGTGWYRKSLVISKEAAGRRFRLDFDGVYMNASLWVNGKKIGSHPYGYTPFSFDITDEIRAGEENIIAVQVDHRVPSSRWYSGSGIYRDVRLTVSEPVHTALAGVSITAPELKSQAGGTVDTHIESRIVNDSAAASEVRLSYTLFKKGSPAEAVGRAESESRLLGAGESGVFGAVIAAERPELWSIKNPSLYTLRSELFADGSLVESTETDYGYRYIDFDTERGFFLNGEAVKLKGVCLHHDQGALGAAAWRRAIERQLDLMIAMGCNSVRITHNPASKSLIELCNEKGLLVIEEFFDGWMHTKNGNTYDYAMWFNEPIGKDNAVLGGSPDMSWAEFDLKATVNRDKNDPSIILWSIGNEIQEGAGGTGYEVMAAQIIAWLHEADRTRPVTIGSNAAKNGDPEHVAIMDAITEAGGVSGTNYSDGASYDSLHAAHPDWKLYGSETASAVNSRGVYFHTEGAVRHPSGRLTSYDKSAVGWGALAADAWYDVITRDFVAGEYVWTGFDYIGEPTPWNGVGPGAQGDWPSPKNSFFGIVDTAGLPKDAWYFYRSQWNTESPTLHILPAWNRESLPPDGKEVEVVVYTSAPQVELFLNGRSLGRQNFETRTTEAGYTYRARAGAEGGESLYASWLVPFEEGVLSASAYDNEGRPIEGTVGRSSVATAASPAKIVLSADRGTLKADGRDLLYISADITDSRGNPVPYASNPLRFTVEGEGELLALDNGLSIDHRPYGEAERNAEAGRLIAIVQTTERPGKIRITAESAGLDRARLEVSSVPLGDQKKGSQPESFYYAKNYYVQRGNEVVLPSRIETRYTDGKVRQLPVSWEPVPAGEETSFSVRGETAAGMGFAHVNIIDEVAALLNYSQAIPIGSRPLLPERRPAVGADGSVLAASFSVSWRGLDTVSFDTEGVVALTGYADVFGERREVSAHIRVMSERFVPAGNIAQAARMTQEGGSASLYALNDGRADTLWQAEAGSSLVLAFDTQQRIGQVRLRTASDTGAAGIEVSEDGSHWTAVEASASFDGEGLSMVFDPTPATLIRLSFSNAMSVSELEVMRVQGVFEASSQARLVSLSVNGEAAPPEALEAGSWETAGPLTGLSIAAADNAAVTLAGESGGVLRILIESEDHSRREVFEIRLLEGN